MPTEIRRIVLNRAEMEQATRDYLRTETQFDDVEDLLSVTPQRNAGLILTYRRTPASGGGDAEAILEPARVLTLLIDFCLKQRIMLPMKSTKVPAIQGKTIALQIDIDNRVAASVQDDAFIID